MMDETALELEREECLDAAAHTYGGDWRERFKPGTFGAHEAVDRLHFFITTMEDFLINHPSVALDRPAFHAVYQAQELLAAAYQSLAVASEFEEK